VAESVQQFYDSLAASYHLVYADWSASVRRQGSALDRILRAELGDRAWSVLDASCGIGTQAIGVALNGHTVHGTDLSPVSVERARREARAWGVAIAFGVADLRDLADQVGGTFDAVLSCDNALPHLLDDDLRRAARGLFAKLRPGGLLIASIRDYDAILADPPRTTLPNVIDGPEGRRIVFQVWDWAEDRRSYVLNLFVVRQAGGGWQTNCFETTYRALRRDELSKVLAEAGFEQIGWGLPEISGFFQPLVTARRPLLRVNDDVIVLESRL
jgi:glycine/sarcosine N-methyltransferase